VTSHRLADAVLPLIRTRADLYRWSVSNEHGRQMHEAVDLLEQAVGVEDTAEVYAVTHKPLASAIKVFWTYTRRPPRPSACLPASSSTG